MEKKSTQENRAAQENVDSAHRILEECRTEMAKQVIGQHNLINGIFMAIIAGGHVLLEGVPGLAKTLTVKTFAQIIDSQFRRMQFTPDLLPADLIGTMIYRPQTGNFTARKGPIFSNIILIDEINRAPAKVQSALLEAMEEHQVTIGENSYPLSAPFFVLATQNPIEQEGTYQLPEAQMDRFTLKLSITYPSSEEEMEIVRQVGTPQTKKIKKMINKEIIAQLTKTAYSVKIDERVEEYILKLVRASRNTRRGDPYGHYIEYGASPRGSIFLYRCAKIQAMFQGRTYVIPDDVKAVAHDVLRHRIVLSYEAEASDMSTDGVIDHLLNSVPVP